MYPNWDPIFERLEATKQFGLLSDYLGQLVRTFRPAEPEGDRLGQGRDARGRSRTLHGATAQGLVNERQIFVAAD